MIPNKGFTGNVGAGANLSGAMIGDAVYYEIFTII